jgi:hypothetical protein
LGQVVEKVLPEAVSVQVAEASIRTSLTELQSMNGSH